MVFSSGVICAVLFSSMAATLRQAEVQTARASCSASCWFRFPAQPDLHHPPVPRWFAKNGHGNTIFALVFPGLVSAFGVFFSPDYMSIPDEVGEAAYLDGCNQWQTFYKVMFPLTGTSVAALTIFTAVFAYGDLMWPLVVNSDLKMMTLSSGLSTLKGQFSTNFPVLMSGSLLAMLPMVILYLIFQRQFVEGIAGTGGK